MAQAGTTTYRMAEASILREIQVRRGDCVTEQGRDPLRVEANPEKRFFINMLIRDIELIPALLDLVDNSVDGARKLRGDEPYDGLYVELTVTPDEFKITDNCGGIDIDTARDYAFRFGRSADFEPIPGSVGQFGIGMKRSIFKIGREFLVSSKTEGSSFILAVDVDEWANTPGTDWSFMLEDVDEDFHPQDSDDIGTEIIVTKVHDTVREDFGSGETLALLRSQLRYRHRQAMEKGLRVVLNGEPVIPFNPVLLSGDSITPINLKTDFEESGAIINVRIFAGVATVDRGDLDDDQGANFRREPDAGWYVFCNNRMLIAADRSSLTGWGNGMPVYHPQYRQFRGYVFIDSARSDLLPWNTTKTGVDQDSRVWRRVFSEMMVAGTQVISMLNTVKAERQTGDEDQPISAALSRSRPSGLSQIGSSSRLNYPASRPSRPNTRKIQYDVERSRFERAGDALGTSTAAEIGRRTFDYFYSSQVGEDE